MSQCFSLGLYVSFFFLASNTLILSHRKSTDDKLKIDYVVETNLVPCSRPKIVWIIVHFQGRKSWYRNCAVTKFQELAVNQCSFEV